jgi:hypothetical protein
VADTEIEAVLRELLGRDELSADTRAELEEFQAQARDGKLEAMDRSYILGLAKRMDAKSLGRLPGKGASVADEETLDHYEEETSWRDRAHEAEARAAAAEAKLQAMKDAIERTIGGAATLDEGPEAQARRQLYDQLKVELERIDRGEG